MKNLLILFNLLLLFACKTEDINQIEMKNNMSMNGNEMSIHDFVITDIEGKEFLFSSLKGKKIMLVNTASKCGLTPQYTQLEEIYIKYKALNFVIVGFPANDFMAQEPGTNDEIATFCSKNYGVTFPMMAKVSVKGKNMHPLYKYLTSKSLNGVEDSEVLWNFQKYLIDENGKLFKVILPQIPPNDPSIIQWLESK